METKKLFHITPRMLIATLIGAVLFTLMSRFIMLPTPVEGTYFFPSYALLGLFATLFGPISGALISLTGMVVVGILRNRIVLSYTIASVICGFVYGIAMKYVRADRGEFSGNDIIAYNVIQVIGNFTAWALIAPLLDIFLRPGRPVGEIFLQGIIASFVDILSAEFIGTPLLFLYSLIRRRQLRAGGKPRPEPVHPSKI
jgi:energy-coupling factor transport system substrate-specific component